LHGSAALITTIEHGVAWVRQVGGGGVHPAEMSPRVVTWLSWRLGGAYPITQDADTKIYRTSPPQLNIPCD
jgi:hypothetical protein